MKRLHQFHILVLLSLLFLGGYYTYESILLAEEYNRPDGGSSIAYRNSVRIFILTRDYYYSSLVVFVFSTLVGAKMFVVNKVGKILLLEGIGGVITTSCLLIVLKGERIYNVEVYNTYIVFVVLAVLIIGTSFYVILNPLKRRDIPMKFIDEILDDEVNQ